MAVSIYQHQEHISILRKFSAEEIIDLFNHIPVLINRKIKFRGKYYTSNISENVIDAFILLLVDSAHLNELEFCDNLKSNGFSKEQASQICYCAFNKTHLNVSIFQNSGSQFLRLKDVKWRLESKISSRSALNEFDPYVFVKLTLENTSHVMGEKNFNECSENKQLVMKPNKQLIMKLNLNRIRHIINILEEALIIMKVTN